MIATDLIILLQIPVSFTDPGTQTITGTSNSNIPSSCYNSSGAPQQSDLWYTMDIENTNSGIVSLGVVPEADGFDAAITVYKGNSCGSLTEVSGGCVNNFQGGKHAGNSQYRSNRII